MQNLGPRATAIVMPLHPFAGEEGQLLVIQMLLGAGADVSTTSSSGRTALHFAVRCGGARGRSRGSLELAVVRVLLEAGADVAAVDDRGETAMHSAARRGHAGATRILLDAGTDVAAANANGATALHLAAGGGHEDVSRMLLDAGAGVAATAGILTAAPWPGAAVVAVQGYTALQAAVRGGHVGVATMLLGAGADVDAGGTGLYPRNVKYVTGGGGRVYYILSALQSAAGEGHVEIVRVLLDVNPAPSILDLKP